MSLYLAQTGPMKWASAVEYTTVYKRDYKKFLEQYSFNRVHITRNLLARMAEFSLADLRRIREESVVQAEALNALRGEIETFLSQSLKQPLVQETTDSQSQTSSRPLLISRVDRIQSRLSQLAAALSPSNRSTCVNERSPQAFHINTPPLPPRYVPPRRSSEEVDEAIVEVSRGPLGTFMAEISAEVEKKLIELKKEKDLIESLKAELLMESAEREKGMLETILKSVEDLKVEFPTDDLTDKVLMQLNNNRIHNAQALAQAALSVNHEGFAEMNGRIQNITETLNSREKELQDRFIEIQEISNRRVDQGLAQVRNHVLKELEILKIDLIQRTSHNTSVLGSPPDTRLAEENKCLRESVRRMKLCIAKWRVDYLNHAQLNFSTPPEAESPSVLIGDNFDQLSNTLARMWAALGPSGAELIEFLSRIEHAVNNNGSLAHVYKDECSRHVEKLPIAELIARREFLLAKISLNAEESLELDDLTTHLSSLISEYERKHNQSFVYDGEEYLRSMNRVNVRV